VVSYFLRYFSSTSTEQISPDSAGPFICFDPVGFAIFATTGTELWCHFQVRSRQILISNAQFQRSPPCRHDVQPR
jgi:hypothetical protein